MELVVRSAVLFGFLWVVMRVIGRKELAKLSAFELVLVVVLGDVVQQGITQEDMSVAGAVIVVSTMALLSVALSAVTFRFPRTRRALRGVAVVLVRDGAVDERALRLERLSLDDLLEAARAHGIGDLASVRLAVLEEDGQISFVPAPSHAPQEPEEA